MKLQSVFSAALALAAIMMQGAGGPASAQQAGANAFDFTFEAINGKPMPLSDFRGRVLLVVNTASFCGFTGQYEALQKLWVKYNDAGLTVIGVPSNDFRQERGNEEEIAQFCKGAFGVTFPLTAKYAVTGPAAHPFYRWANGAAGGKGQVEWNFHKYLVAADGSLAGWFPTRAAPDSAAVTGAIEAELAKRAKSGS